MKYYGTHKFEESVIGNICKFKKVNIEDYIIIPNISYKRKGSIFIDGGELGIVDEFNDVIELLPKDDILGMLSNNDFLNKLFFNTNNILNFSDDIYILGEHIKNIPISNAVLSITLNRDTTGNITIIDATINEDFTYQNYQKLNEILNIIFINKIQIPITFLFNNKKIFYNIINNYLYITNKYNNVFNISGVLFALDEIKEVIDITSLYDFTDSSSVVIDYTFSNIDINILYYPELNDIKQNKILNDIKIPDHKHDISDINISINKRNGILYIDDNNYIDLTNRITIKNIDIIENNNTINQDKNISDKITVYNDFCLELNNIDITTILDYTFDIISGNYYYYVNGIGFIVNANCTISYSNYKYKNIPMYLYEFIDVTDVMSIIEFLNNNHLQIYVNKDSNNIVSLKYRQILDSTHNNTNIVWLNNNFDLNILLSSIKLRLDQQYITNIPSFYIDNTSYILNNTFGSNNFIIKKIYNIKLINKPFFIPVKTNGIFLHIPDDIHPSLYNDKIIVYDFTNINPIDMIKPLSMQRTNIGESYLIPNNTTYIQIQTNGIVINPPVNNNTKFDIYLLEI